MSSFHADRMRRIRRDLRTADLRLANQRLTSCRRLVRRSTFVSRTALASSAGAGAGWCGLQTSRQAVRNQRLQRG